MHSAIVSIVAGMLLLLLGRRLFWLFVALLGFVAGMTLSTQLLAIQEPLVWVVGIVCGVAGALIALFLQRLAIGIAGVLAGAMIALSFTKWLGLDLPAFLPGLAGGFLGAVFLSVLFDWALIFLSSLSGASLIVQAIAMDSRLVVPVFLLLAVLGIFCQAYFLAPRAALRNKGAG